MILQAKTINQLNPRKRRYTRLVEDVKKPCGRCKELFYPKRNGKYCLDCKCKTF